MLLRDERASEVVFVLTGQFVLGKERTRHLAMAMARQPWVCTQSGVINGVCKESLVLCRAFLFTHSISFLFSAGTVLLFLIMR